MKPSFPHILQTPEWGMAKMAANPNWRWWFYLKNLGEEIRLHCSWFEKEDSTNINWDETEASFLVLERKLPMGGTMYYIPRGPYLDWADENIVAEVLEFIKRLQLSKSITSQCKPLFIRMEPNVFQPEFPYDFVREMGFIRTDDFVQAHDTVKVDIDKSDNDLMASFHSKHRYNIRLAEKRGLTVRSSTDPHDVSIFYQLTKKTDTRKAGAMNPHPEEYYQSVVSELAKAGMVKVYIVEKENVPVSSSIVFIFGEEAIYMFGAADYEYRRDMPNHLREWASMRDARDAGCKWFDLWGVTMRNDPGEGIKRYKLGYRDHIDKMAGTFDYAPVKWKYQLFDIANRLRRVAGC